MKKIGMVLVSVVVFAVIAAALALAFDTKGFTEAAKRVVYGPPPEPVSASITITPDGSVTVNGERMGGPVAAVKTQVTDAAQTVSGRLGVYNQTVYPILISAPVHYWYVNCGGFVCVIHDISTDGWSGPPPGPSPPPGTQLTYACYIAHGGIIPFNSWDHEFVYMTGADDDDIERDFSFTVTGRRLWREAEQDPSAGRTGFPVYAKERSVADTWETVPPVSWNITFGTLSASGTQTWMPSPPPGMWIPVSASPIDAISIHGDFHKGQADVKYAALDNLQWSGADVNLARYVYGTYNSGLYLDGKQSGMDVYYHSSGNTSHYVSISRPAIYDFTKFRLPNRSDEDDAGLRIAGGFKATNHYPATLGWSTTP